MKTILIVDDSASIRQVVSDVLTESGYDVLQGSDGEDALLKLDGRKVHLIVSDINMPNMDGITFIKEIKKMPLYKFTPILMLTSELAKEKKEQGDAFGLKGWVIKPFQPEQLLSVVKKLVLP